MNCAWKELLAVLPRWLTEDVDRQKDNCLQEIRLRLGQPPQLFCSGGMLRLWRNVSTEDLNFCVNAASRYSPWAAQTVAQGFLTASGGHRIGICGEAVVHSGAMTGIRTVRSLCIRVARDFPGIAEKYAAYRGSVLIIGPPGSGKTTFLRDLIRQISRYATVAVVDERRELFPDVCFAPGQAVDVLSGCSKIAGIDNLLRTMGPEVIAVDEITSEADCRALLQAGWCGVRLLATAHAASVSDLRSRPVYAPILREALFDRILTLQRNKTVLEERMSL